MVTLGSPADSLLLDWNVNLAANDSVIVAGRLPVRGGFAVYDREGRQVGSHVRYGGGPGEFMFPVPAVGPGDSIWIVDPGNQRVSVLDPGASALVRAFPLRGSISRVMAADSGRVVVAGTLLPEGVTREEVDAGEWHYLHVLDRTGRVMTSFHPRGYAGSAAGGMVGSRVVASAGDRIWVAKMHRPALEEWSLSGERLRRIDRELDWFEPWDSVGEAAVQGLRTRPRVSELGVDGEGRLWIKTYLPVADRETATSTADHNRVMDTLLEALDPETGELLAQRRFDPAFISRVAGTDLWATVRQDSAGYVFVDIWRPSLRER